MGLRSACFTLLFFLNQTAVRKLRDMALFDLHSALRMSSYDALASLKISFDMSAVSLEQRLSEVKCESCRPKPGCYRRMSATQAEFTSTRKVEVLYKLLLEGK